MSDSFKIKGRLIKVSERIDKTDKFTIRIFAIQSKALYPQPIKFQLTNDRCDIIDPIKIGEEITVHFDIRGTEWQDKIINNLNCWRVDRHVTAATVPPASDFAEEDSALPF